jgi:S-adenosylmethionine hydrolase
MPAPVITLLTDFGARDAYPGIMKGVVIAICPEIRIVDLTHEIPPQAVVAGALVLRSAVTYFPQGSIHVAVVDPGVGSARQALVVTTAHATLVGPDNGLLAPAAAALGGATGVWRIERQPFVRAVTSRTFHGRDVFAPAAAHLATGVLPSAMGPTVTQWHDLALPQPQREADAIRGEVIYIDHFGNLITNVDADLLASFRDARLSVTIAGVCDVPLVSSYAEVPDGAALAVINSWNMVEIAIRNGHAADRLAVNAGASVVARART